MSDWSGDIQITETGKSSMVSVDDLISIAVIGAENIGKSSLIRSLRNEAFNENESMTMGAQFSLQSIELDNHTYSLRLCDIAGQTSFNFVRKQFMRNSDGAIIVFDLTNPSSFSRLNEWIYDFLSANNFDTKLPILLVGNKSDLDEKRKIRITDIKKFMENIEEAINAIPNIIGYMETSAKSGIGVKDSFNKISKYINGR